MSLDQRRSVMMVTQTIKMVVLRIVSLKMSLTAMEVMKTLETFVNHFLRLLLTQSTNLIRLRYILKRR